MKKSAVLAVFAASFVGSVFAASTVSDVVVRQRWPWSDKVDIDYTLSGDKGDVTFSATWDGQSTPVIIGTDFQVEAGQHRFEWCPTNNYAGQTLTGFTVTADVGDFAAHKYLVLDLANGGYSFMSAPPEGGWTSEYKSTKMVFARCPAGTYVNGLKYVSQTTGNIGDMEHVADKYFSYIYALAAGKRTVTLTSDWYVGIYPMTKAQYSQITSGSTSADYTAQAIAYDALRGATNDSPSVNWPSTRYNVSNGSVVRKLRRLTGDTLCIDLPQEEQFEVAARAGTTTFWANGGTTEDSLVTITNKVNEIINWYSSTGNETTRDVGLMADNGWGLYDLAGNGSASWCLDTDLFQGTKNYPRYGLSGGTDPVGRNLNNGNLKRIVRSTGQSARNTGLFQFLPSMRYAYAPNYHYAAARFAIHLKPLNFGD